MSGAGRRRATFSRRVLGLLPALGVRVVDLFPGTVVLARRQWRPRVRALGADAAVVSRRGRWTASSLSSRLGPEAFLVRRHGGPGLETLPVGSGAVVVAGKGGYAVWPLADAADGDTDAADAALVAPRDSYETLPVGQGTVLATSAKTASQGWLERERSLAQFTAQRHIAHVLDTYAVTCVLDVGANRGQFAQQLRANGYHGRIVSFEPVPETFAKLRRAAAQDRAWTVHQLALGREDGETEMNVVPGTMSSILPASEYGAGRYERLREPVTRTVPVRRLDGVLASIPGQARDERLYLKLDTQGFDVEAFLGLGDRVRDLVGMQSEVALLHIYEGMPAMLEALAVYQEAGMDITGMFPVSREGRTARVLEYDCVMVRAAARPQVY